MNDGIFHFAGPSQTSGLRGNLHKFWAFLCPERPWLYQNPWGGATPETEAGRFALLQRCTAVQERALRKQRPTPEHTLSRRSHSEGKNEPV